jgi:hypothetical protein
MAIAVLALNLLGACTTVPVDERAAVREEINARAGESIATLVNRDPQFQKSIDDAAGYFAARLSATKVPIVGGGFGIGVLYDRQSGSRTYMNITRFDLGPGLGAGRFRVLVLFERQEILEQFRRGIWKFGAGAESAAGTQSGTAIYIPGDGYSVHIVSETGAALVVTARAINLSVNRDLTDVGVSEVSIPNTGFVSVDEQGEDAPRIWDRRLPFLAQQVVDKGYDLPLTYGIGVTYADVTQDMLLDSLEVGINGNEEEPFDFVSFENAESESDSLNLKLDAWLFPFMNVFVLLGKIDGKAPMDIFLDGNGMLDQLGTDCTPGPGPPNPLCTLLEDETFLLEIEADFKGNTYGLGTVLAGGWSNWFVTIPLSVTYADMDGKDTEGLAYTATPRGGRVLNLGRKGNLALFVGGNYLRTDLTVRGTETTPDGLLEIDYTIDQENEDEWAALLGFNWDINRRFSWAAEYNGFVGSREAFITSVVWRY